MKMTMRWAALAIFLAAPAGAVRAQDHSALWGAAGEKWSAESRLPDFSFAGYRCGEKEIPTVRQVVNVRAFGAKGDGKTDDTEAVIKAIAAAASGAVFLPAGRYKITKILTIAKSGVVLRGAGADKTTLVFPKPLNDIKPNWGATTSGKRTSNYSWSGGLVWFRGSLQSKTLTKIVGRAKRGQRELRVQSAAGLAPGQWVIVALRDDANKSLLRHLYSGDPGNTAKIKPASHKTTLACRITAVKPGRVAIDRPLPFDIEPAWTPELRRFAPTVTESGIENIAFEFPARAYGGHFTESGYNAIAFSNVAHCWARNIRIINADSGVIAGGYFCTIRGITFASPTVRPARGDVIGHHGIYLRRNDNLFTEFDFQVRFIHDITVSHNAGNVCSNGKGVDLCFDHHKRAPYANLFTNIDIGAGTRMWRCGGGRDLGRNSGAHETFWNIRAACPQGHPGGFGPATMNLVGLHTDRPAKCDPAGVWFEPIDPTRIRPQNLHAAQLARRLRR